MRILPGTPLEFANQTPTAKHLTNYLVNAPEILPNVATMFDSEITAFSSLLARRNMFSGKLADPLNPASKRYKVIGSRKVMWDVKGFPERKARIVRAYNCDAYPTQPGKKQTWIDIYLDTNWFSPRDVIELADNRSFLYVADSMLPQVDAGIWHYRMKVNTNDVDEYIQPSLLAIGMEMSVSHTAFEELSETAYEKYTFHEKAATNLTIQRLKWSISGTADELRPTAVWMEHEGVKMWAEKAQIDMMRRAMLYRERQLIQGKSTVTADDKIILKTSEGFEIMEGDGILNQGDGAWRLPYNVLSTKTIDSILDGMSIYGGSNGMEVAVICGRQWYKNFARIMKEEAGIDPKTVEIDGMKKGINMDYDYYQMAGIKIIPTIVPWFDSPMRASVKLADGSRASSHNAIFVSIGDVDTANPAIELLALGKRGWLEGEVNGLNKGGDMSNSVDGRHHHIGWETGIALKDINGIAELYRTIV